MELSILKMVFFFGEEDQINNFLGTLKPRCIKETNKSITLSDGSVSRLVYNTENNSYIDQYMNYWQWCDRCQKMFRVTEQYPKKVKILHEQQRVERVGSRNMRQHYEMICPYCDNVVPCYGSDAYIYTNNERTRCLYDKDNNMYYCDLLIIHEMDRRNEIRAVSVPDGMVATEDVEFDTKLVTCDTPVESVVYNSNIIFVTKNDIERLFDQDVWQQCSTCHVWNLKSNMANGQCSNCQITIFNYHSWSGQLQFLKMPDENTEMYFGIELETVGDTDNKSCVAPYQDLFHLERDGSLGQGGFEIISQPMTFNFILSQQDRIKNMFERLIIAGQKSHESSCCGLHIHVSSKAFNGDEAINRAVAIVNGMQRNIMNFARRGGNQYCHYQSLPNNFTLVHVQECINNRYDCVNLENRGRQTKNTIEFRMFKGTLNFQTFLASIVFVKNIVEQANKLDKMLVSWKELVKDEVCQQYLEERRERGVSFDNIKYINFSHFMLEDLQSKWMTHQLTNEDYLESITNAQASFVESYQAMFGGDM